MDSPHNSEWEGWGAPESDDTVHLSRTLSYIIPAPCEYQATSTECSNITGVTRLHALAPLITQELMLPMAKVNRYRGNCHPNWKLEHSAFLDHKPLATGPSPVKHTSSVTMPTGTHTRARVHKYTHTHTHTHTHTCNTTTTWYRPYHLLSQGGKAEQDQTGAYTQTYGQRKYPPTHGLATFQWMGRTKHKEVYLHTKLH